MAIEKVEGKKKVELTKEALFQLIGAGTMAVLAVVLAWFAFSNWRAKSALLEGFQAFEGNRVGEAKRLLQDAASWKPDHVGIREVLGKIACDAGGSELATAEDQYKKIQGLGGDTPTVKVGMGVVLLKRAEKATAPKEILDLAGKAQAQFKGAGAIPEGEIGLGHVELLLASKLNEPKRLVEARKIFEGVRKNLGNASFAAKISRDGLIDYYSGLGRVLATSDKPEELREAREAFQSCSQMARAWEVPRANMELVEARRWSLWKGTAAEIAAAEPEVNQFRRVLGSYWKDSRNSDITKAHRIPWMTLSISFAQALARSGNASGASAIFSDLRSSTFYSEVADPLLLEFKFRCDLAMNPNLKTSDQDLAARDAVGLFDPLMKRLAAPVDDAAKDRKAKIHNNFAVMRSFQGASGATQAKDNLGEALKLYPDDYVYNRNLLLVLKRSKALPAAMAPVLEKAKAAATGPWAEDFEKLQKVLDEK